MAGRQGFAPIPDEPHPINGGTTSFHCSELAFCFHALNVPQIQACDARLGEVDRKRGLRKPAAIGYSSTPWRESRRRVRAGRRCQDCPSSRDRSAIRRAARTARGLALVQRRSLLSSQCLSDRDSTAARTRRGHSQSFQTASSSDRVESTRVDVRSRRRARGRQAERPRDRARRPPAPRPQILARPPKCATEASRGVS